MWGARNKFIFENKMASPADILEAGNLILVGCLFSSPTLQARSSVASGDKQWVPPNAGCLKLNTDASFSGHGEVRCGVVVRDHARAVMVFCCRSFSWSTVSTPGRTYGCEGGAGPGLFKRPAGLLYRM